MDRKLYRSRRDRTIAGVCGGLGEYYGIDPTFIRIITVLLVFANGVGLIAYLVAWIIIPNRPVEAVPAPAEGETPRKEVVEKTEYASWNKYIPGAILILLGMIFMVREFYWWWHLERFWPVLLVILGLFLVFRAGDQHRQKEQQPQGETNESSQI